MVIRCPARAVIYSVDTIKGKRAKRAGCITYRKVELVRTGECASFWVLCKGQHDMEPALRRLVEIAAWIRRQGAEDTSSAVDGRWKVIERIESSHTFQCLPIGVIHR